MSRKHKLLERALEELDFCYKVLPGLPSPLMYEIQQYLERPKIEPIAYLRIEHTWNGRRVPVVCDESAYGSFPVYADSAEDQPTAWIAQIEKYADHKAGDHLFFMKESLPKAIPEGKVKWVPLYRENKK